VSKTESLDRIVHVPAVSESSNSRKLRDRKPSIFNAFEIFDHTGYRMATVLEVKQEIPAYNLVVE
jgi:hypothetical protein